MIVYNTTKTKFLEDVSSGCIEDIVRESVKNKLHKNVGNNEYLSWKNSLNSMYRWVRRGTFNTDSAN